MNIHAIPTRHNGIKFRSRLEAKWAAFFDLAGWRYEYEPIDLKGYIPDFILLLHEPVLAEVKPCFDEAELLQYRMNIEQSGWEKEVLLLGARVPFGEVDCGWDPDCGIGLLGENGFDCKGERAWWWATAVATRCDSGFGFVHDYGSYWCRNCGASYKHFDTASEDEIVSLWKEAGNAVQWKRQ